MLVGYVREALIAEGKHLPGANGLSIFAFFHSEYITQMAHKIHALWGKNPLIIVTVQLMADSVGFPL